MSTTPGVSFFDDPVIITVDKVFVAFFVSTTFIDKFFTSYNLVDKIFSHLFCFVDNILKPLQHKYLSAIILLFLLWIIPYFFLIIHKMWIMCGQFRPHYV